MINYNNILVFDFETGGLDTATLEPIQIAGVVLDPRTLKTKDTFSSLMRPLDFNNLDPKALEINKKTKEELREAPEQKVVWEEFVAFVKKANKKGTPWTAPIAAGKNIRNFDIPIVDRLCRTYGIVDKNGKPNLFNRIMLDLEDLVWPWFESDDCLANHKMDTYRAYFGQNLEHGHDALFDVLDTAELIVRFIKLCRNLKSKVDSEGNPVIKFKGSCARTPATCGR